MPEVYAIGVPLPREPPHVLHPVATRVDMQAAECISNALQIRDLELRNNRV